MAEVFFCFFKNAADAFLFSNVIVQLLNVSFGLFRAFAFDLGACAFGFLGVSRRSFYFAHVTIVAEVNNDDDRDADEEGPESSGAKTAHDESGACGAREITDRDPK